MPITERVAADLPVTIKTATYTLLPDDWGREIQFQSESAVTANVPAVAGAGNGYNVIIRNIGAGTLTIDPAGSEQIDGASTASLSTGDSLWIRSDGTEWKSIASNATGGGGSSGGLQSMQVFTSSGTYDVDAATGNGIKRIKVTVIGGGGGAYGRTANNNPQAGDGGGAGGASIRLIDLSGISGTINYVVGAGGAGAPAGNNSGTDGGTSSFGTSPGTVYCSATGGGGGDYTNRVPGAGGNGANGQINMDGEQGSYFDRNSTNHAAVSGRGGSSMLGGGAPATNVAATNGANAVSAGAGGAGGYAINGSVSGGDGADGIVIVEEYA